MDHNYDKTRTIYVDTERGGVGGEKEPAMQGTVTRCRVSACVKMVIACEWLSLFILRYKQKDILFFNEMTVTRVIKILAS